MKLNIVFIANLLSYSPLFESQKENSLGKLHAAVVKMKIGEVEIIALLVLLVMKLTRGDTFYTREDPCISLCEKTSTDFSNVRVSFVDFDC